MAPKPAITPDAPATQATDRNPDRPQSLDEIIGQAEVIMQLRTVITGAVLRGQRMSHVLISGSPGMGKTSLAEIVATELEMPLLSTTGMLLKRAQDVAGLVMSTQGPAVLFVDEVHAMGGNASEACYQILEDGKIDILAGSGPNTVATTRRAPDLIVVGATTAMGLLSQPFRDRFGLKLVMTEYTPDELATIVARYWKHHGAKFAKDEALQVAARCRGVPRNAVTLANRVLDYASVVDAESITPGTVANASHVFGIDNRGLESNDRKVLTALTGEFCGRAVGLDALAAYCDIDKRTVQDAVEPFLCRSGWMIRTRTGRLATDTAYDLVKEFKQ